MLSYSEAPGAEWRDAVDLATCIVTKVPHRRLICIDSDRVTFHLRCPPPVAGGDDDYIVWAQKINQVRLGLQQRLNDAESIDLPSRAIDRIAKDLDQVTAILDTGTPDEVLKQLKNVHGQLARLVQQQQQRISAEEEAYEDVLSFEETEEQHQLVERFYDAFGDLSLSDVSASEYEDAPIESSPSISTDHDLSAQSLPQIPSEIAPAAPVQQYRTALPAPAPPVTISIGSLLRKTIGKDSAGASLPVQLNEPLGGLQRMAEELEYAELLDQAAATTDLVEQMALVAAWSVSAYASPGLRAERKPFNPMLGETFEWHDEQRGWRFIAEKVSHRPLWLAAHAHGKSGWQLAMEQTVRSKFWGKSIEFHPGGLTRLTIGPNRYEWRRVTSCLRNVLSGTKFVEYYGEQTIHNRSTGDSLRLTFKANPSPGLLWAAHPVPSPATPNCNEVVGEGRIDGQSLRLVGRWDEAIYRVMDPTATQLSLLWRFNAAHRDITYYGFSPFALRLNDLNDPNVVGDALPPTDTRLRPDQRLLEHARLDEAEQEKARIEQRQRDLRAQMEAQGVAWQPQWFSSCGDLEGDVRWEPNGRYWECRERREWPEQRLW